jgi:hypothetical protein
VLGLAVQQLSVVEVKEELVRLLDALVRFLPFDELLFLAQVLLVLAVATAQLLGLVERTDFLVDFIVHRALLLVLESLQLGPALALLLCLLERCLARMTLLDGQCDGFLV